MVWGGWRGARIISISYIIDFQGWQRYCWIIRAVCNGARCYLGQVHAMETYVCRVRRYSSTGP